MKQIEIHVAPDGSTRVETRGFQGAACRDASRFLRDALGQTQGEQLTAEFHANREARHNANIKET